MRITLLFFCYCLIIQSLGAQINPENIQIARDEWGVPHIFAPTDAEVAYGLAWAHAEDNFIQMQEPFLAAKGLLGGIQGIEGAIMDIASFLIKTDEIVTEQYEQTFSLEFKKILTAYTAGVNRYAALHPEEVLHKKLFPITEKEVVKSYVLATTFISNVQQDLALIFGNKMDHVALMKKDLPAGSNGLAFAPSKTKDGKTYLVSNSHQPLRSYLSWYEVHVQSEEGWNFLGATFAGGVTPFVGTNENLGWTHCVNYNDYSDVYELEMNPKKKLQYKMDGEWLELKKRVYKGKVKVLGFLKLGIRRKFYESVHGPVIKNKSGYYALRFPANMVIGAPEQWYRMNKAKNWEEFEAANQMQQHPSISTTYTDKEGNIVFIDNGLFPYRNPKYDWGRVLPGNISEVVWKPNFLPLDSLLMIKNPSCGYVYHMNGTGFSSTGEACRPNPKDYPAAYMQEELGRNKRMNVLMPQYEKLSYDDIKQIKYDKKMELPLYSRRMQNLALIGELSPEEHPKIAEAIAVLKKWNGSSDKKNKQAALVQLTLEFLFDKMTKEGVPYRAFDLDPSWYPEALEYAQKHLLKHFGELEIELGQMQKHVRGHRVEPVGGMPEVMAAMYVVPYQKKYRETNVGESYILMARYGKDGVEQIETVNCYGASNRPESPHYADQMDLYLQEKLKPMTLNKATVIEQAKKVYSPE
jgi:acyl-homoserine-lactone acylase